jgi:uncharacterized damage-inducible protein DinB
MLFDAKPLLDLAAPYDLLGAILQDGTNEWRWEMDPDMTRDGVVWQPYPGMHSIGAIILHIASVEVSWFERFVLGYDLNAEERSLLMTDSTDVDEWRWPEPPRESLPWYFDLHDRIRARTLEGLKAWPPADEFVVRGDDRRTPRWVLGHVIQHEAYHGGQAVLLGRLWQMHEAEKRG